MKLRPNSHLVAASDDFTGFFYPVFLPLIAAARSIAALRADVKDLPCAVSLLSRPGLWPFGTLKSDLFDDTARQRWRMSQTRRAISGGPNRTVDQSAGSH